MCIQEQGEEDNEEAENVEEGEGGEQREKGLCVNQGQTWQWVAGGIGIMGYRVYVILPCVLGTFLLQRLLQNIAPRGF